MATSERHALAQSPPSPQPAASTARADNQALASTEAWQDVEAGRQDLADKDYSSAWIHFSHAYDASHDPQLLVELAMCERATQQYARAARHIEQALAGQQVGVKPAQVAEARQLYNALLPFVGHVRVTIDPPGATVFVDDVAVGQSPLATDVLIDPGEHRIRVTRPGFIEFSTLVEAPGGSQKLLDVKLQPAVEQGRVRIHTSPHNTVVLDGVLGYGNWDGRVVAGRHSLKISAPGMLTFEPDLVVAVNRTNTFDVSLQPDTGGPAWLWVTGGAVVAATVVVAILSVFHPEAPPALH